ncbi:MAG: toprim domain-containing protein [Cellulosilyticaceae bacterium]
MTLDKAIETLVERLESKLYGKEYVSKCPICGASEKKFYLNSTTGVANCKRGKCGYKGNATTLFKLFGINETIEYEDYVSKPKAKIDFKIDLSTIRTLEESDSKIIDYFIGRGIGFDTLRSCGIMFSEKHRIMAFPFIIDGVLNGITYRTLDKKIYKEAGSKQVLLGVDTLPPEKDILYITEGEIDWLTLREAGILSSVSVPNGVQSHAWIDYHWELLNKYKSIVICFDNDEPGKRGISEIRNRLDFASLYELEYGHSKDINDLWMEDQESFYKTVRKPKPIEMDNFVSLQNVRTASGAMDELFSCGIPQFDRIFGGLGMSQSTIVFSESGCGKSTVISNIVKGLLSKNEKVCIFSGELSNSMLKSWLYATIGGEKAVDSKPHPFRPGEFITSIKPDYEDRIDKMVDGKLWIYDGNKSNAFDMLNNFEKMHKRHGIRWFIKDNLSILDMTVKGLGKYEAEEEYSKKVASFTRNNKLHLMLVAHPTKTALNTNPDYIDKKGRVKPLEYYTQQQVKGSASIVNLAHNVMAMCRAKGHEKAYFIQTMEDQYLKANRVAEFEKIRPIMEKELSLITYLVKNRSSGVIYDFAFFGYDSPTRRIYGINSKADDISREVEVPTNDIEDENVVSSDNETIEIEEDF